MNRSLFCYVVNNNDNKCRNLFIYENGDILYFMNYSKKSDKGDLYIYSGEESTRIDYDVSRIYTTTDEFRFNFVYSYVQLMEDIEIDWDDIEISFDD